MAPNKPWSGDPQTVEVLESAGWLHRGAVLPGFDEALLTLRTGPDPDAAAARLVTLLSSRTAASVTWSPASAAAAIAVCGASRALAGVAAAHPEAILRSADEDWSPPEPPTDGDEFERIRRLVGVSMLEVAVRDLAGRLDMPAVGAALAEIADAAAAIALPSAATPMAVIALGKWGGRELNYASDIDLVFVHEGDDDDAREAGLAFIDLMSRRTPLGIGFRVDTDLRPEGSAGPLTRTIPSYTAYWEKWAETWELQALVKARVAAGDADLGRRFLEAARPFVYPETLGAAAVRQIRLNKARTEEVAGGDELKRGVGGIRDVEFAVQLLQLVHGRADPGLRSANTLAAIQRLGEGGYIGPEDATRLAEAYAWLRHTEHRLQLYDLRQTHELPPDRTVRERVAKAAGYRDGPDISALSAFEADLVGNRRDVRAIHERLFFRPLLETLAQSSHAPLDPEAAERQLTALGFADTEAARRAVGELTAGLSRRSRLMEQLLPLMLDWLSTTPDPDLGLDQLRLLVGASGDNAQLISAVRDNPVAAERLCTLLGTSSLLGRLVDRIPPFLPRLGDDRALDAIPSAEASVDAMTRLLESRPEPSDAAAAIHRYRAERLLWIAASDLLGHIGPDRTGELLSDLADAVVGGVLTVARRRVAQGGIDAPPMAIVAMGRWGGRESNYGGDLDALVVFEGGESAAATEAANRVVEDMAAILGAAPIGLPGPRLDLDLRPEGRKGVLARSLESFQSYYERWAETWEFQALLRARPAAGDAALGRAFLHLAHDHAFPEDVDAGRLAEIRRMKARIEKERIPPGEDPSFHVKLGRGGMADVEWTVQLLQLRHGRAEGSLRVPSTMDALESLTDRHIDPADAESLAESYRFCTLIRNRMYLQEGRTRDSLPREAASAIHLARSLGHEVNPQTSLREEYRRLTRRSRRVMERVFYGSR